MVGFTPTPPGYLKGWQREWADYGPYLPYPKILWLWPPFRLFAYCHGRLTRSSDYGYPLICNNLPWHGTRTLTRPSIYRGGREFTPYSLEGL